MGSQPDTITKIAVRGFKSIADEQEIELRPLTLLAGANSSGKSSIMQPILLLKQTLETPSDPGALLLDGPNVRFTSAEQLLSQMTGRPREIEFAIRIELLKSRYLEVVFKHEKATGFDVNQMSYYYGRRKLQLVPNMSDDEVLNILPTGLKAFHTRTAKTISESFFWSVQRERCFLSFGLSSRNTGSVLALGSISPPTSNFIPHLPAYDPSSGVATESPTHILRRGPPGHCSPGLLRTTLPA